MLSSFPTRVLVFFALATCLASSTLAASSPREVTLKEALDLGSRQNGDLIAKLTGLDQAAAREEQAKAPVFPKVNGTVILSPLYGVTGDALHTNNDFSRWGAWVQSTVTILEPLYTFGKLSSLREAAARGSDVARAGARKDQNELAYSVKELFYGAVLSDQLYHFLVDGKKDIDEIVTRVEADQQKKRPTIPKRDFYRLKLFSAEASYRVSETEKLRSLARHALSLSLGFDPNEETLPADTQLSAIEDAPPGESQLVTLMSTVRPEFEQLTNGIAAKKALLHVESTNKYPMLFAGGMLTFAYSNVRTGQESAFAYDPYNRSTGGVGVGAQWNWDFATTLANESAIRVEIDELEKKQSYAQSGFRMELKKALADLVESRSRLETSRNASQVGKRWLVAENMGYSVGLTDVKNLIDAYLARAKSATDYWEAIYHVNMSWAALSKTVGKEITPGLAK